MKNSISSSFMCALKSKYSEPNYWYQYLVLPLRSNFIEILKSANTICSNKIQNEENNEIHQSNVRIKIHNYT